MLLWLIKLVLQRIVQDLFLMAGHGRLSFLICECKLSRRNLLMGRDFWFRWFHSLVAKKWFTFQWYCVLNLNLQILLNRLLSVLENTRIHRSDRNLLRVVFVQFLNKFLHPSLIVEHLVVFGVHQLFLWWILGHRDIHLNPLIFFDVENLRRLIWIVLIIWLILIIILDWRLLLWIRSETFKIRVVFIILARVFYRLSIVFIRNNFVVKVHLKPEINGIHLLVNIIYWVFILMHKIISHYYFWSYLRVVKHCVLNFYHLILAYHISCKVSFPVVAILPFGFIIPKNNEFVFQYNRVDESRLMTVPCGIIRGISFHL